MATAAQESSEQDTPVAAKPTLRAEARRIAQRYGWLALLVAVAGLATPLLGRWSFWLELGCHFVVYYTFLAGAALVVALALKDRAMMGVAILAVLFGGLQILPWYTGRAPVPQSGAAIRVLLVNVLTANTNHRGLMGIVRGEHPDIIALQEIDDRWVAALDDLEEYYPHSFLLPQSDNFGIGILSRLPLVNTQVLHMGNAGVPSLRAEIDVAEQHIDVLIVHTMPPARPSLGAVRNAQLKAVPKAVEAMNGPVIVLGDLNVTMWSPYLRDLVNESGLLNARRGEGIHPTWPADLAPFLIPIDQCLYSTPLTVIGLRRGPFFGSDHLPLIVDFALPDEDTEHLPALAAES